MKEKNEIKKNQIVFYQADDGTTTLDVRLEEDTVWLSLNQMAELFDRDKSVISRHIKNVFKEGELNEVSVVAKNATTAADGKTYVVEYYNLDVIISVGYRVKSKRGTQFRIWANRILKEYLVKGYAINNKIQLQQYNDLKQTVKLLSSVLQNKELSVDEATGLLQVISDYAYALDTLDKYDYQQLSIEQTTTKEDFRATYEKAKEAISILHDKFGGSSLFGNEKDESFKSSVNTIYQTFDGNELYPSVEEKAAMFLYLVTKNHSFSDGNKRIAAFLFLWFLEKNGILYKPDRTRLIENNTLVALTMMIAESRSEEKDVMVRLVVNLINKNN
ncbi:virulence RhuM family protein [Bacteroides sp. OttesenSCG-928-J23]|nr:virulence RhuM family protein [Bacteroides sp. OttesenSCG-928-J23]MDL2304857.1 virulence RhuM family protein [Bacteroides sp. OttesenSCG-928-D19]